MRESSSAVEAWVSSSFDCRVMAVVRSEDGVWRLVHAHSSVGVPDEEVLVLQQKWSAP
jgi:SnoaL-like domain